jgi:hypothetical protein
VNRAAGFEPAGREFDPLWARHAGVAEQADATRLNRVETSRVGSTPTLGTNSSLRVRLAVGSLTLIQGTGVRIPDSEQPKYRVPSTEYRVLIPGL